MSLEIYVGYLVKFRSKWPLIDAHVSVFVLVYLYMHMCVCSSICEYVLHINYFSFT